MVGFGHNSGCIVARKGRDSSLLSLVMMAMKVNKTMIPFVVCQSVMSLLSLSHFSFCDNYPTDLSFSSLAVVLLLEFPGRKWTINSWKWYMQMCFYNFWMPLSPISFDCVSLWSIRVFFLVSWNRQKSVSVTGERLCVNRLFLRLSEASSNEELTISVRTVIVQRVERYSNARSTVHYDWLNDSNGVRGKGGEGEGADCGKWSIRTF